MLAYHTEEYLRSGCCREGCVLSMALRGTNPIFVPPPTPPIFRASPLLKQLEKNLADDLAPPPFLTYKYLRRLRFKHTDLTCHTTVACGRLDDVDSSSTTCILCLGSTLFGPWDVTWIGVHRRLQYLVLPAHLPMVIIPAEAARPPAGHHC